MAIGLPVWYHLLTCSAGCSTLTSSAGAAIDVKTNVSFCPAGRTINNKANKKQRNHREITRFEGYGSLNLHVEVGWLVHAWYMPGAWYMHVGPSIGPPQSLDQFDVPLCAHLHGVRNAFHGELMAIPGFSGVVLAAP